MACQLCEGRREPEHADRPGQYGCGSCGRRRNDSRQRRHDCCGRPERRGDDIERDTGAGSSTPGAAGTSGSSPAGSQPGTTAGAGTAGAVGTSGSTIQIDPSDSRQAHRAPPESEGLRESVRRRGEITASVRTKDRGKGSCPSPFFAFSGAFSLLPANPSLVDLRAKSGFSRRHACGRLWRRSPQR